MPPSLFFFFLERGARAGGLKCALRQSSSNSFLYTHSLLIHNAYTSPLWHCLSLFFFFFEDPVCPGVFFWGGSQRHSPLSAHKDDEEEGERPELQSLLYFSGNVPCPTRTRRHKGKMGNNRPVNRSPYLMATFLCAMLAETLAQIMSKL